MQKVQVRKAQPEDKPQMLAIAAQIWDGDDYLPNVLDKWLADENGELSVALVDGRIVGVSKLTELIPGHGWLQGARVEPGIQGRGIGRALTLHHIGLAQKKGMSHLRMVTDSNNKASRTLAEKLGFRLLSKYFRYRATPLDLDEGINVPEPPLFRGIPPVPANGMLSLGWTFFPWHKEMLEEWGREGRMIGSKQAGLVMPDDKRRERLLISYLWGEPNHLKHLLQFTRKQPAHVERITCIVSDDYYHDVLIEAGFEKVQEYCMVLYELELGKPPAQ